MTVSFKGSRPFQRNQKMRGSRIAVVRLQILFGTTLEQALYQNPPVT